MTTNFIDFSKFPWGTQCLEMSKTTGRQWPEYRSYQFRKHIKNGFFDEALQDARSVGSWSDSIQGHEYWEDIYDRLFNHEE